MIAVDASAILTVLNRKTRAQDCYAALQAQHACLSEGSLAELNVVAAMRQLSAPLDELVRGLRLEVAPVDAAQARAIGDAYRRWGKGAHRARLDVGDCFASLWR